MSKILNLNNILKSLSLENTEESLPDYTDYLPDPTYVEVLRGNPLDQFLSDLPPIEDVYSLPASDATNQDLDVEKYLYFSNSNTSSMNKNTQRIKEFSPSELVSPKPSNKRKYELNKLMKHIKENSIFSIIGGALYLFNGMIWDLVNRTSFVIYCKSFLKEDTSSYLNTSNYTEIYNQLTTEPSLVIPDNDAIPDPNYICFKNGVYDISQKELLNHSPKYYFFTFINCNYYKHSYSQYHCFDEYINTICGGYNSLRQRILEVLGYIISDYNSCKIIPVLYGPRNTGKTTFARLIECIVGSENCESFNINDIDKWTAASFFKKKVCFNTDMANEMLSKKTISLLKQLSGGDKIKAERKGENPFSYYNTSKIVLASNYQIILPNKDTALRKRILPLPFLNTLSDDEINPNLLNDLRQEMPYIIYRCIDALHQLIDNNFTFSPLDEEIDDLLSSNMEGYIENTDDTILIRFINEACSQSSDSKCFAINLYKHYVDFINYNYKNLDPLSQITFSRKIRKFVNIKDGPHCDKRSYCGIQPIDFNLAKEVDNYV